MKDQINIEQDQHLYDALIKQRDLPACEEYLRSDRPKWMKADVERYQNHLRTLAGPLSLTVSVYVTWDKNYDLGHDNVVRVLVDEKEEIKTTSYVAATPGSTSGVIGTFGLDKVKLETSIKFKANIVEEDIVWHDATQNHPLVQRAVPTR